MLLYLNLGPLPHLAAVLRALIIIAALIGLTMHPNVYACKPRRHFWAYYTNLSNLAVLLYFALVTPALTAFHVDRPSLFARMEYILTADILLTFCVFHLYLYPGIRQKASRMPAWFLHSRRFIMLRTDNALVHYIVPFFTFLYWFLCSPGGRYLVPEDIALCAAAPILYLLATYLFAGKRGVLCGTDSRYPYPFLDADRLGPALAACSCARLLSLLILLCCMLFFLAQARILLRLA